MNNIIIELSAEDRARLDKLAELLERLPNCEQCVKNTMNWADKFQNAATPAEVEATEAEPVKAETNPPKEEKPAEPEKEAPWEQPEPVKVEPSVTLEQIQQKVVQLAAGNGGAKKAQVREIISTYGSKVSDLKEQPDKWDEVWTKLTALEG